MGDGHGGTRLHQPLKGILHQSLALGVECRGGLVENQDGRVLQDGTGNAHPLALTTAEPSSAVADIGVVAVFRLHDELVGIGYTGSLLDLLARGIVDAKRDIVEERVVEEDGLLIHIAYELAQVVNAQFLHVDSVDEHLAFLHVVIARDEVDQRRLSPTRLDHQRHGLALLDGEINVLQHPLFAISERHVAELNGLLEALDMHRVGRFLDMILGQKYLVDTLHRRQALGNVVACLRKLLQWVDDAIENHHVIDKGGTDDAVVVDDQDAAEPQHNDNHHRA